ncbi:MAG: hypothetical protein EOO87_20480 [Pedobacter sp.]|nr:MAG: hypothetical protein EOO87_20480 [Pedobacter sp.]
MDAKEVSFNGKYILVSKYYYADKLNYKADRYMYVNNDDGLLFIESLNSGNMIEYDINQFNEIHKEIALKKIGFKDGIFELQYAKRNYKDFK